MNYLMAKMYALRAAKQDEGATAVEYGLMVGLIAVVIIGAVTLLGTEVRDMFTNVTDALIP
jgi:pilus assembly protein Flp/PilA